MMTRSLFIAVWLGLPIHFMRGGSACDPATSLDDPQNQAEETDMAGIPWNVPLKTAGGTQLWTDHAWRSGYRIQQNILTGHWRLLDPKDVRRAWGTRDHCQVVLDELVPADPDPAPKHYVILLHGLMRTSHSMGKMGQAFRLAGDVEVVQLTYASSRGSIAAHAKAVREVMEGLPPNATFSFVAHSMGNIVTRCMISDLERDGDPKHVLERCQSMVMLGPPNQGAAIARRLAPTKVFGWITGPGGMELGAKWETLCGQLATPPFPFLILAGEVTQTGWTNPLVEGESDFVVSVEEASLEGAEKLETVPVLHSFLMQDDNCITKTIAFIESHRPVSVNPPNEDSPATTLSTEPTAPGTP